MKYDFTTEVDRRQSCSLKWDVKEGELPMWVADMDFQTAPCVREALARRVEHGVFGYTIVPDAWRAAYAGWWESRHHFRIEPDWLIFCTGIVPAISSVVRKLTTPGENVLILTPVYNIFYNSILNNGCHVLESPLAYEDGGYHINWKDFEAKLALPQTSLLLLCNPHNPTGNIWSREELARIGELAAKYHVVVLSDEIHCDLTDPGYEYIPFASVSGLCANNCIMCIAPTKAFNIAGLQTAAVVVPEPFLRHKVDRGLNTDEVAEPNAFAVDGAIAAFNEGEEWLEELRSVLAENKRIVTEYIRERLPQIHVVSSHATYLLWLDCSAVSDDTNVLCDMIRQKTGLYLSAGEQFGGNGKRFVRFNTACPKSRLLDGLERLRAALEQIS